MWIYDRDQCDYIWKVWENPKKQLPPNVHKMNKDEAALMRRLMSETGMTENEIRSIKKYRKLLSVAQDEGEKCKRSRQEKYINYLMKCATKELKLAKEHPLVLARYKELLEEKRKCGYFPWFMW